MQVLSETGDLYKTLANVRALVLDFANILGTKVFKGIDTDHIHATDERILKDTSPPAIPAPSRYPLAIDLWLHTQEPPELFAGNFEVAVQSHSDVGTERKQRQSTIPGTKSDESSRSAVSGARIGLGSILELCESEYGPYVSTHSYSSGPPISVVTSYRSIERMDNYSNPPSSVFAPEPPGCSVASTSYVASLTGDVLINSTLRRSALKQTPPSSSTKLRASTNVSVKSLEINDSADTFKITLAAKHNQNGHGASIDAGGGLQESFEKCVQQCGVSTMQEILDYMLMHKGDGVKNIKDMIGNASGKRG